MDTIRKAAGLKTYQFDSHVKFYLAARYGRKDEIVGYAELLLIRGYGITSTWIRQVEDEMLYEEGPDVAGRFAEKDYSEIDEADVLVYFSEEENNPWGRGGRHVEFGYAIGRGKLVYVVGPLENLFHYHPGILAFANFDQFLDFMVEETADFHI